MIALIRGAIGSRFMAFVVLSALLTQAASAQTAVPGQGKLVVFAAASMQTALDAIASVFVQQKGEAASISYGSSAILAKQIEHGAPAAVFNAPD